MYSLKKRKEISKENIYEIKSPLSIFSYYCKGFSSIHRNFRSPLREGDKNPSACIMKKDGNYIFTDFGNDESCDAIGFVSKLYGCSYVEAMSIINKDFNLGLDDNIEYQKSSAILIPKLKDIKYGNVNDFSPTTIKVKTRGWNDRDFHYWTKYGWLKEDLMVAHIYPISHYQLINESKNLDMIINVMGKLAYTYDFGEVDGLFRRKLYFPFCKKGELKCITNARAGTIQGDMLPSMHSRTLIITKAYKDIGIFRQAGYDAIAPNSENQFINLSTLNAYRLTYDHIFIWYDNDEAGIINAKKYSEMYGIPRVCNDIGHKDPSDFCYKNGVDETIKMILNKTNPEWKKTMIN